MDLFDVTDRAGDDGDRVPASSRGVLTIDLDALAQNYRTLARQARGAEVAGVVKANGYGLGALPVAQALHAQGCRTFFVAHLAEALEIAGPLRQADVLVLNGLARGEERICADRRVVPVLNDLNQAQAWSAEARRGGRRLPAALQLDSGMSRLGLSPGEVEALARDPSLLEGVEVGLVMSHLACADEPAHPANAAQLECFASLARMLPAARLSLANSAGVFLGAGFHHDLVRPGIALYGARPLAGDGANPMRPVVRLQARVVQLRSVPAGTGIGYGYTAVADRPMRLATIGIGYADGWPRRLGGRLAAWHGDTPLPTIGRVSMDSIILDAGAADLRPGDLVDLIGERQSVDAVARAADTIPYEILTSLGARLERRYVRAERGATR